jgi:Cu/Ag efflux protein CusF
MKLRFGLLVAAIVAAPFAPRAQGTVERDLSFERTRSATVTATVKSVDLKTRKVTVVGESGKPFTFEASEEVKNLPQLKAGDVVTVDYYDSVAVLVTKPGKEGPVTGATGGVATAKPGEKPGAAAAADVTIAGTVTAIAPDKTSVTLKSRTTGGLETLPVKNPENLTGVMVGDEVTIYATRALAVSVAPAKEGKTGKKAK